jgi:flagellar biosynthesis/type III secretory pathway chaperone
VDPGACREHLQKLLAEEFNALTQLETLLDREHELLLANDVDGLDHAGESRQVCVGALLRVEDERRSVCRMMNVPADVQGLEKLLRWCDPSNTLHRRLSDCAERATRCRELNDRNGALVTARLKKVEGMLDVLTGRANQPKVYGRQGMFQPQRANARVLASV